MRCFYYLGVDVAENFDVDKEKGQLINQVLGLQSTLDGI